MPKSSDNNTTIQEDISSDKSLRSRISEQLKRLGIKHPELPKKLEEQVDHAVEKAASRAEALVTKAQKKAALLRRNAQQRALKRVLSPAHVCATLSKLYVRKEEALAPQ